MSRFGALGNCSKVRFLLFGVLISPLVLLLPLLPRELILRSSSLKFIKSWGLAELPVDDDPLSCFDRFGLEIDEGNLELMFPSLWLNNSGVSERFVDGAVDCGSL